VWGGDTTKKRWDTNKWNLQPFSCVRISTERINGDHICSHTHIHTPRRGSLIHPAMTFNTLVVVFNMWVRNIVEVFVAVLFANVGKKPATIQA